MIALALALIGAGVRRRPCRTRPRPASGPPSWRRIAAIVATHTAGGIALGLAVGAGVLLALRTLGLI